MTSYTISKRFGPFPAAHRQAKHSGHCALIHGHNWYVVLQLARTDGQVNELGFVFDFGELGFVRDFLTQLLDHTCLIAADDPARTALSELDGTLGLFGLRIMPTGLEPSAEHLAYYVANYVQDTLNARSPDTWVVQQVTVEEDEKNSATCRLA